MENTVVMLNTDELDGFKNHPYRVLDETIQEIKESVKARGIQEPLIVRKKEDNRFEIISGHRRKRAAELNKIVKVPCIIVECTDEEAIIKMVDSNIHRDEILPSEKARAYRMKYDALKRQGKKNILNLETEIVWTKGRGKWPKKALNEGHTQIHRYIRISYLYQGLLDLVDQRKMGLRTAVELSYIRKAEQEDIYNYIKENNCTPTMTQAHRLRVMDKKYELDSVSLAEVMAEQKPNQKVSYKINYDRFEDMLPDNVVTANEVEDYLYKCLSYCMEQGIEFEKAHEKNKGRER